MTGKGYYLKAVDSSGLLSLSVPLRSRRGDGFTIIFLGFGMKCGIFLGGGEGLAAYLRASGQRDTLPKPSSPPLKVETDKQIKRET